MWIKQIEGLNSQVSKEEMKLIAPQYNCTDKKKFVKYEKTVFFDNDFVCP